MVRKKVQNDDSRRFAVVTSAIGVFIAGLCCFSPLVLFFLGLATASVAGSYGAIWYEQYKWYFRLSGLIFLAIAYYVWYKKKSAACSLSEKKRLRNKILNLFLITVTVSIVGYILWVYVILEWVGVLFGLWG